MRLSRERHSHRPPPVPTAENPLVQTAEVNFICPHCGAFYEVVRAKALPDSVNPRDNVPDVHWTASRPRSAIRAQILSFAESQPRVASHATRRLVSRAQPLRNLVV